MLIDGLVQTFWLRFGTLPVTLRRTSCELGPTSEPLQLLTIGPTFGCHCAKLKRKMLNLWVAQQLSPFNSGLSTPEHQPQCRPVRTPCPHRLPFLISAAAPTFGCHCAKLWRQMSNLWVARHHDT